MYKKNSSDLWRGRGGGDEITLYWTMLPDEILRPGGMSEYLAEYFKIMCLHFFINILLILKLLFFIYCFILKCIKKIIFSF